MSSDPLDVPLHDPTLHEEVELTAMLIVAANEATTLSQDQVDAILLGVPRQRQRE